MKRSGDLRVRAIVALSLAYVAGFVDALGYRAFGHVFTSHLTGNTSRAGFDVAERRWSSLLVHATPIVMFVIGAAIGALLAEVAARRPFRSLVAPGLGLVAALLVAVLGIGEEALGRGATLSRPTWSGLGALGLAATAMGVQTVTFRRIGGMTVRTTFLTGMVTNFAEEAVDRALSRRARRDRTLFAGSRRPSLQRIALLGGLWVGFLIGCISGGLGESWWHVRALVVPIGLLVLLALLDLVHPYGGPVDSPDRRRVHRWKSGE